MSIQGCHQISTNVSKGTANKKVRKHWLKAYMDSVSITTISKIDICYVNTLGESPSYFDIWRFFDKTFHNFDICLIATKLFFYNFDKTLFLQFRHLRVFFLIYFPFVKCPHKRQYRVNKQRKLKVNY